MELSKFYRMRRCGLRAVLFFCIASLVVIGSISFLAVQQSHAHFNLNVNIRVIHISHEANGLRAFIRLPMAYLIADKLGPEDSNGNRKAAPFTTNSLEDDVLVHYLDKNALERDPLGLGQFVLDGHQILIDGNTLAGELVKLTAYPALQQAPFAQLEEARRALKGDVYHKDFEVTYVGDTIIDAEIFYPSKQKITRYKLKSTLNPGLERQNETANLILDHQGEDVLTFRIRGLLSEPTSISRSVFKAISTFIWEGMRHIFEGLDHVLFVFCLVLGATQIYTLLWRVTGFTIGHSITLTLGFFGFIPKGAWFVPFVETTIALSIIYAAVIAISNTSKKHSLSVTTAIGILHGLGFSFVLSKILQVDSNNLWQSLLAFNIGVEIGQIAIVLISGLPLYYLTRKFPSYAGKLRLFLATPCIIIASIWAGQRSIQLISSL